MGKKVTVVGAGFYGSTTAQRLAEYDIFDTVVLTDIVEGKPEGLALDLNQARPIEGYETKVVGKTTGPNGEGYEVIEGSDIVVITAGLPRKPGMSRMDLLEVNAKIVRGVSENIARHAPDAVVIVVSNPLDEMTALAQTATGFPRHRVLGQAGVLDNARFTHFVAETLSVPVKSVKTLTLGSHGDTMVPVPSQCTVDGKPLTEILPAEKIEELVVRTRNGGAEVVALLHRHGWQPAQVDVTVVAEEPRLAPFVEAMRRSVAGALGLPPTQVGIKATTNEGLGFPGRREGIAALAVALITPRP